MQQRPGDTQEPLPWPSGRGTAPPTSLVRGASGTAEACRGTKARRACPFWPGLLHGDSLREGSLSPSTCPLRTELQVLARSVFRFPTARGCTANPTLDSGRAVSLALWTPARALRVQRLPQRHPDRDLPSAQDARQRLLGPNQPALRLPRSPCPEASGLRQRWCQKGSSR